MNVLKANEVWGALKKGGSARLTTSSKAKFVHGDTVVAKTISHPGHIRLPKYVQGCRGSVVMDHGSFIFPDSHAAGVREPERLYSVRFEASDLWGNDASQRDAIYVDLFESYLTEA